MSGVWLDTLECRDLVVQSCRSHVEVKLRSHVEVKLPLITRCQMSVYSSVSNVSWYIPDSSMIIPSRLSLCTGCLDCNSLCKAAA